MSKKVLIVEDDVHLARMISPMLTEAGYTPLVAHTAEDGLDLAQTRQPDLIILDVMVPTMGGWELCRKLRAGTTVPIIFMTALGDTADIVRGLNLGADDYVRKPFDRAELLARVSAHLRRQGGVFADKLTFGQDEITIDFDTHIVMVRGEVVEFTPREFDLLATLARQAGRVIRTEALLEKAWGANYADARRNIKTYIHYLRRKIEVDPADPHWILTVRGVGYRFASE